MNQGLLHVVLMCTLGTVMASYKLPLGAVVLIALITTGVYLNAKRK